MSEEGEENKAFLNSLLRAERVDLLVDGNGEFCFPTSAKVTNAGARKTPLSYMVGDIESLKVPDAEALFPGADFVELKFAIERAGFPQYPTPVVSGERERIAQCFTGAVPSNNDPRNLLASLSWVLVHFAEMEYAHSHFADQNDLAEAGRICIQMGRLVEWWVWRREGHDADAVRGERFKPKDTEKATRGRGRISAERKDAIIELSKKTLSKGMGRKKNGKINCSELARGLTGLFVPKISQETARKIIADAIQEGKLV